MQEVQHATAVLRVINVINQEALKQKPFAETVQVLQLNIQQEVLHPVLHVHQINTVLIAHTTEALVLKAVTPATIIAVVHVTVVLQIIIVRVALQVLEHAATPLMVNVQHVQVQQELVLHVLQDIT